VRELQALLPNEALLHIEKSLHIYPGSLSGIAIRQKVKRLKLFKIRPKHLKNVIAFGRLNNYYVQYYMRNSEKDFKLALFRSLRGI
jgi:hypothetical protein